MTVRYLRAADPDALRRKIWQSIRVFRHGWTIADLCRTTGSGHEGARKFVRSLEAHGFIRKAGKRRKQTPQSYALVREPGPLQPILCDRCGRRISAPECRPEVGNDAK